jgi:hypothetical protein
MNNLERVLSDDLARLMDRLAASIPEGALAEIRTTMPTLRVRLDEVERHLAAEHAALADAYGHWRRTLEDLENVWALAAWRSSVAEEPAAPEVRRAA